MVKTKVMTAFVLIAATDPHFSVNAKNHLKYIEDGNLCKFKAEYFSEFDINPLTKPDAADFYHYSPTIVLDSFDFNICADLPGAPADVHVRQYDSSTEAEVLYGGKPEIEPYLYAYSAKITGSRGEGNVRGVKFTYQSETQCSGAPKKLQIAIECDDENDAIGGGKVLRVDNAESCQPRIIVTHAVGCPDYYVCDFTWLNYWKPELFGSILVLLGLGFGCFGKRLFGLLSALTFAIFIVVFILYLTSAYSTLMKSMIGTILLLSGLALLAIIITLVFRRHNFFSINITALGALFGFIMGNLFYLLLYSISGWESFAAAITITLISTILNATIALLNRGSNGHLTWLLGLVAGSLFTRGLSLFFGGYPLDPVSWTLLKNGMPLEDEIKPIVWLYLVLTILLAIGSACWLATYEDQHSDPHLVRYFDNYLLNDSFSRATSVSYSVLDDWQKQKERRSSDSD